MNRSLAFAFCLLFAPAFAAAPKQEQPPPAPPPVAAVPKLTLPESVAVSPGEWAIVPFTSTGGAPKFYFPDVGLNRVQLDALFGDEVASKAKALVIKTSPRTPAGRYRLVGYCGSGSVVSEATLCEILVGDVPPPQPPGPTPAPGPAPPPGPIPPPADPFARGIWDAYQLETSATKAADAAAWSTAFQAAVGHVDAVNYRTAVDLKSDLKTVLAGTRPGALPKLKPLINAELDRVFGVDPTSLLNKAAAKTELQRIADALGGLR